MLDLVWLIPALPLAGFVLILLFGRRFGEPLAGVVVELRDGVTGRPILGSEALPGLYDPAKPIRTVTDANGRFVPGLRRDDFEIYEDGVKQDVQQFDSDRVPVSLGIVLDTSGSMAGPRIQAAQAALNRFLFDLLGKQDEVFLYRFDSRPELVHSWTTDRAAVSRALGAINPRGGTALYDSVAEAVPLAQRGTQRKKALVIISDGDDTNSHLTVRDAQQIIRNSELLVYAIAIDSGASPLQWLPAACPGGGSWSLSAARRAAFNSDPGRESMHVIALERAAKNQKKKKPTE